MDDIPLYILFLALFVLMLLSAFFSSSETSMMALNRYRLRHLVNERHKSAILAEKLLSKPDKLLGLILFGNNLVNVAAASVATIIGLRLYGETGIAVATILLTILLLIFAEITPKTIAALYPERIAFPASYVLTVLGKLLHPLVWIINRIANSILGLIGLDPESNNNLPLTRDELRTVVAEAGGMIPARHRRMLISILDMENITVDEIMVPRNEITGLDLNDSRDEIIEKIINCQHTRLPVYRDNIDNIVGILHVRRFPRILTDNDEFTSEAIVSITKEPYFVPLGTPLHVQLRNFQRQKKRLGLVVDEYGDIQGLVTLEDILEEIVGEFTTDMQSFSQDIYFEADGTVMIDGTTMIRDINRHLGWTLPTQGPKTLNGLILEQMEDVPEPGTSIRIENYTIEVVQSSENAVKRARIRPLPAPDEQYSA